jgi:tetratricopeptide (TPR) repeat protein
MAQRDVLWERGKQLQENNDYKAAEAVWRQMIALLPEDPTGYNGLGYALSSQGRNAEAEAAYRKSIQADPNYVAPLTNLAMLLAEKEMRVTEAEALYRQALKLDPSNISAKLGLGEIYLYQNRYAEAEDMYRKALEVTPEDARLKEALRSMIELHALHDRSNQSKQTTTPLITAGENLKDAVNSGGSSGTEDASNASQSQKALDEASSSLGATGQGLQSTTPEGKTTGRREDAVAGGSKIFDTKGEKIAAPPVDLRGMGKAPTDVKLLSHIPKNAITDNDKEIKASVDWYSKLESDKADTQQKIANIQKQIENKQGDQGILKMEQTQYTNDLQNIQQNQQRAEDAIKKRLVKLDMPWIETPAPPKTETKPDTATQEKQP